MNKITKEIFEYLEIKPYDRFYILGQEHAKYYIDENLSIWMDCGDGRKVSSGYTITGFIIGKTKFKKIPQSALKRLDELSQDEYDDVVEHCCSLYECKECPLRPIDCSINTTTSYYTNKEYYSDKTHSILVDLSKVYGDKKYED